MTVLSKALVIGALLFVAACANNIGGCPPLVDYSKEEQQQLKAELEGITGDSMIVRVIVDYGKLRDQCRVR